MPFRVETDFDQQGKQWWVRIYSNSTLAWEGWVLDEKASCWDAIRAAIAIYESET